MGPPTRLAATGTKQLVLLVVVGGLLVVCGCVLLLLSHQAGRRDDAE